MRSFECGLAQVAIVEADSQGQVARIGGALVLADAAITQRGESHRAERVAKFAQVFDLAHVNVGISLVERFGVGAAFAAERESAASGCIEVVIGHGGSSKGTLDKAAGRPGVGLVGGDNADRNRTLVSDAVSIALGVGLLDPNRDGAANFQRQRTLIESRDYLAVDALYLSLSEGIRPHRQVDQALLTLAPGNG